MFSLRQVHIQTHENVPVGTFQTVSDDTQGSVYKLVGKCCSGTYNVYMHNARGKIAALEEDYVCIYTCHKTKGCRLLAYTLKRQRLLPVFTKQDEEEGEDIYLVLGDTLLDCQASIENATGLKVVDGSR